jgi:hypothetical protein
VWHYTDPGSLARLQQRSNSMIERLRQFVVAASRAALNTAGVRPQNVYAAVGELLHRYEVTSLDLTQFELKAFSQNGEDGVIQEIVRRIGAGNRTFVEFGIGDGREGNCVFLSQILGWRGVFVEADPIAYTHLARRYEHSPHVSTEQAYLEPATIEPTLLRAGADSAPTVLSIDVDGNDYYLWEALETIRPRLVVIEYNASLDPRRPLVQPYSSSGSDGTAFFGASIAALRRLGLAKGYRLVHTELAGVNAFFVRDDLAQGDFLADEAVPLRPPNYYLDDVVVSRPCAPGREYVEPSRPA